jgi:predicted AAA+ superfamily ATPase
VRTYLEEEVRQEGITRNLSAFARFLEAAAFSQGGLLNISGVARDCAVERKVIESWFGVLDDLLIARRIPVFSKRSKRRLVAHPKFYFFDAGIFRTLRPSGPLDAPEEAEGHALETLLLQNLVAVNDGLRLGYAVHYWRTSDGAEVDFVLYGPRGLFAFEVKRKGRVDGADASGLRSFLSDYPKAGAILAYGGERRIRLGEVDVWPVRELLLALPGLLAGPQ